MDEIVLDTPALRMEQSLTRALWQATAWPGQGGALAAALERIFATPAPGPNALAQTDDGRLMRVGPLSWQAADVSRAAGEALAALDPDIGTALDLGHSRVRLRVSGPRARDAMMRLAPLDFRDAAFPEGAVRNTQVHHVGLLIARSRAGYDVYVPFTFARALRELLEETAAQWRSAPAP